MAKFRKKPIEIEAWHWDAPWGEKEQPAWMALVEYSKALGGPGLHGRIVIETLEGTMYADYGDWIIRGVKGELYPCKPDIFEKTYDPL